MQTSQIRTWIASDYLFFWGSIFSLAEMIVINHRFQFLFHGNPRKRGRTPPLKYKVGVHSLRCGCGPRHDGPVAHSRRSVSPGAPSRSVSPVAPSRSVSPVAPSRRSVSPVAPSRRSVSPGAASSGCEVVRGRSAGSASGSVPSLRCLDNNNTNNRLNHVVHVTVRWIMETQK